MASSNGVRVVLNRGVVRDLLRGSAAQALVRGEGDAIARRAGPGVEVEVVQGRNRARSVVRTVTDAAKVAQRNKGTLRNAVRPHR